MNYGLLKKKPHTHTLSLSLCTLTLRLILLTVELRPHSENVKSLTLEEYLLKKKKKKKKHREDERTAKKVRYVHNKAVQTVCAGLGADLTQPICPDQSLPGTVKHESNGQPGRETIDNHQPYLHALKLGHVPFLSHQDHYIRSTCLQTGTWYGRFMHEERQANGGGLVLHAYADELACLSPAEMECFTREFLELAFAEKPRGAASYALAVVHSAATYLPDFLDYFAFNFPNTPVKMEIMGKKDIETTTIANFHSQVCEKASGTPGFNKGLGSAVNKTLHFYHNQIHRSSPLMWSFSDDLDPFPLFESGLNQGCDDYLH